MTSMRATWMEELERDLTGEVILPGHEEYEEARRTWIAMVDKCPAIIIRCATTSDVVRAVRFARDHGLPLAVRSGGHNIAGDAVVDGGLVIDLSRMRAAHVDSARRRVTVRAGATLADHDAATQTHGLATTTCFT